MAALEVAISDFARDPLWPQLYDLLLKGETGAGDDAEEGRDS